MRTSRNARVLLAAGLCCGLAPIVAGANPVGPAAACDDNRVRIDAGIEQRQALVEAIAAACGLRLVQQADLDGATRLPAGALPLADLVERLLADESYQLHVTGSSGARRGALWIFADGASIPPEARELIETTLLQAEFSERRAAVRELRRLANADAVRLLSFALADADERIREAAAESLAAIGGDEALAALASAGASGDSAARASAAEMIALSGGESALDYLANAMNDPDPRVRAAAVQALGDLDTAGALALIRRAAEGPDVSVRRGALDVLEELDDDAMFRAVLPVD